MIKDAHTLNINKISIPRKERFLNGRNATMD